MPALVNQDAIRQALVCCIGEGIPIYWDGEAEAPMYTVPYTLSPAGACHVVVKLSTGTQVGQDEMRTEHNETTDMIETTAAGNRLAQLSLRIESNAREESTETAERVRTRLRFRAPKALLNSANISIATIGAIQNVDYSWDNRDISACVLDIQLNIGSNDRDEDITFIEKVNGNNVVNGPIYTPPQVASAANMSGTIAVNGTNFQPGALVSVAGKTYTPSMVTSTVILFSATLSPGTYDVTVVNPDTRSSGVSGAGKLTV